VFQQLLTPISGNLGLSFAVAALPIVVVLIMLGVLRRPAWQASLAGLISAFAIAVWLWRFPVNLALSSAANGVTFALWPVMWIVFSALLLYNIAVISGRFNAFRDWIFHNLPNDKRVVLIVIGFCFGALLEGIAGFGTPIAICSSLLILVGWSPLEALTYTLILDTAPVAFGALGVPVTVLAAVTHLPDATLGAMIGRQLPIVAIVVPFYVIAILGGRRSLAALWPVLLVAGGSMAATQFAVSNFADYRLADVLSSLTSLIVTVLFLRRWHPAPDPKFAMRADLNANLGEPHAVANVPEVKVVAVSSPAAERDNFKIAAVKAPAVEAHVVKAGAVQVAEWQGWIPWLLVSGVVIVWTYLKVFSIGDMKIPWPGLNDAVFITLYNQPYAAVWDFQPLATGTAILVAAIITAAFVGVDARGFVRCVKQTLGQVWLAVITVALIIGLAYLMNYSGMAYTLGKGVASLGVLFPLASVSLGWVAGFLSGSDTSANALFGNLQVVAANQLQLNPILFAATNASGGVMGKMISPQNITTGVSVTDLKGKEGVVFARTFVHSIVLTVLLSILVAIEQYLIPGIIPH
jgi:lactate permease